ncbi:hypothetical protein IGI04_037390 [Brassica rapa subsp. trilocularis]|uniref:Uncharacterized protein n=1 Tax=Brassica rapa subsp. trilocularis TaxID=1813537 RepID=A0ABQ7KIC9_BRACM|nr:hypothetical protein IGI04_042687 [Brassica rapa subsp. trilocularis]KAG5374273.1 hypothetical protein IGI04_042407 [Brassica rapa subsp. trilocularis]KAG5385920.1 hypothetical protein IGI04_037390 [Brassica rapa subsp. trilocularis]
MARSEEKRQWCVCEDHEAIHSSLFLRGSNLLRSMMKDEEAMSKAASSVEVIGEWLKHPHVAQATRWRLYKKKKQPRLSKRSCISKKRLIWCVRALQPNKRLGERGRDQD